MSTPAAYATVDDLTARYGEATLRLITDPDAQSVRADVARGALQDASQEIDAHLGRRYVLPLAFDAAAPATDASVAAGAPVLVRACCDIAVYRLQTLRPADDIKDARQRYDDVLKLLRTLAAGETVLPFRLLRSDAPNASGGIGLPAFGQPPSLFGRDKR